MNSVDRERVGIAVPDHTRAYLPRFADDLLADQPQAIGAVLIEGVKSCGKTATARQRAASEVLLDADPEAERRAGIDRDGRVRWFV